MTRFTMNILRKWNRKWKNTSENERTISNYHHRPTLKIFMLRKHISSAEVRYHGKSVRSTERMLPDSNPTRIRSGRLSPGRKQRSIHCCDPCAALGGCIDETPATRAYKPLKEPSPAVQAL